MPKILPRDWDNDDLEDFEKVKKQPRDKRDRSKDPEWKRTRRQVNKEQEDEL